MGNRAAQENAGHSENTPANTPDSRSTLYLRTEMFCDSLWCIISVLFRWSAIMQSLLHSSMQNSCYLAPGCCFQSQTLFAGEDCQLTCSAGFPATTKLCLSRNLTAVRYPPASPLLADQRVTAG